MTPKKLAQIANDLHYGIRTVAIVLLFASPAPAATITPAEGMEQLIYIEGVGFRPIDDVQTYGGGKASCPMVVTWQHPFDFRRTQERRCTVPDDVFAGFVGEIYDMDSHIPLGVLLDTVAQQYSTETSTGGGGGDHCCGYTPVHNYQPTPEAPSPVPLPASVWMLLVALGLTAVMCRKRRMI